MALNSAPLKASPAVLADWIEIATLANPRGTYAFSRLKRLWDTHRETEKSDPEGRQGREEDTDDDGVSGQDDDAFLDSITDEIGERQRALGCCYAFEIASSGHRLTLCKELTDEQFIYIFCLLLTNCAQGDILDGSWIPTVDNRIRDLFQACSTVAAAGEVSGCAVSFGWPRPNRNPPFLRKLKEVYSEFGEGKPVDKPRPGAATSVKDEEIDIIAWRPRKDRAAGTTYLLGQVASGNNWQGKSLMGGIAYFHRTWFDLAPASQATASIFIPHAVPPGNGGSRKERMDLLVARFGTILDRLRIPLLAKEGLALAARNTDLVIERVGDIPNMTAWVKKQIKALRAKKPTNV